MPQRSYNLDIELLLADGAAAVTADGISQVASANVSKLLGPGRFEGVLIVDVSAIDIVSNDEIYNIMLQGTNDNFTTREILAHLALGATEVRPGGAADSVIGRYELPFTTEQHDVTYSTVRLYVDLGGTTPSITYKAWIAERY